VLKGVTRKRQIVQGFLLKLVNNHSSELECQIEGPRLESRVRLSISALVIPTIDKEPDIDSMFTAVTKEFSTNGLSLILNPNRTLSEVLLGFFWEKAMRYVRASNRHTSSMGFGFFQKGFRVNEVICAADYPELSDIGMFSLQ